MLEEECDFRNIYLNNTHEHYYEVLKRYYKPVTFPHVPGINGKELD